VILLSLKLKVASDSNFHSIFKIEVFVLFLFHDFYYVE